MNNKAQFIGDHIKGEPLTEVYAVGGPEGYWMPGNADQCLTRQSAHALVNGELTEDDDEGKTAIDPVLFLGVRMQERLLELGVAPAVAALVCRATMTDVDAMLTVNGFEERVACVKIAERDGGNNWVPQAVPQASWADEPLWPNWWNDFSPLLRSNTPYNEPRDPIITLSEVNLTCGACPLQFDAVAQVTGSDQTRPVYFRLRHGYWYIEFSDKEESIAGGEAWENDGSATFSEVQGYLREYNVILPDSESWGG